MNFRKKRYSRRNSQQQAEDNTVLDLTSTMRDVNDMAFGTPDGFAGGAARLLLRGLRKEVRKASKQVRDIAATRAELAERKQAREAEGPVDLTHLADLTAVSDAESTSNCPDLTNLAEGASVQDRLAALEQIHRHCD